MSQHPQVMGIDLSFRKTGYMLAVLDPTTQAYTLQKGGTISNPSQSTKARPLYVADDDIACAKYLTRQILELIDQSNAKLFAIEVPTGGAQGARANRTMGIATGLIAAATEVRPIPVVWVQPGHTKALVPKEMAREHTGKDATKAKVQAYVRHIWPGHPWDSYLKGDIEHVADAAGALLVAKNSELFNQLVLHNLTGESSADNPSS